MNNTERALINAMHELLEAESATAPGLLLESIEAIRRQVETILDDIAEGKL